jgi:2,3,4,5-tetrahydropyridine-2-carboxylate N-succinyltransferase
MSSPEAQTRDSTELSAAVDELWERRTSLSTADTDAACVVSEAIDLMDAGLARVVEFADDGTTHVNEWLRRAISLMFVLREMDESHLDAPIPFRDRFPLKRIPSGVRAVPGAIARHGAYLGGGVVLMPSFVNIGAWVGASTMVDTWATVGSCASVGERVHLAGGVGIGGVLEPPGALPVIVEDDAFVGSRCVVVEGARVGRGAVLGAGVVLSGSVPVIDAATGDEISRGSVPAGAVVIPATRPKTMAGGTFGLPCALVISWLPAGERHDKAGLNDLVRAHGATL